ncbi:MAG: ankyrin repeat domain-containing protein [Verrucomicrobiales bacterium]|nr:ankyrin repeat domain-containing protein [Verrucomicrobiales bacterium]
MSESTPSESSAINFHAAVPILRIRRHALSLDFFTRVLGFKVDWNVSGMASVSRGCCSLMLCDDAQGHPRTWVWIGVDDAEALHGEFVSRHATIRLPPTNYPWAFEFHLEDPDGHILRFGSEPREDRPFSPWVAWYEPAVPPSFSEALTGLMNGDFTRLASLVAGTDGSTSEIIRWHKAGLFQAQPEALDETFTCACFNGCIELAERLLAHGLDPSGGAATGLNAFHWAVNRGHLDIVRLLIRHKSPLDIQNNYGGTVLGCAVWSAINEPKPAHPAIIETLLLAGAHVHEAGFPTGNERIDEILRRFGAIHEPT